MGPQNRHTFSSCRDPLPAALPLTNRGQQHVVEEEGEGDDEQHELPRVARLVEMGADARARQVLAGHAHGGGGPLGGDGCFFEAL